MDKVYKPTEIEAFGGITQFNMGYNQGIKDTKDDLLKWAQGFTESKIFVTTLIDKLNKL